MKYKVANDELGLKHKSGLYCFLPYERIDKDKKAVFKCGMTTQDFADRIEHYHTYYPLGVYMCFFLSHARIKRGQNKDHVIRDMEKDLFDEIVKQNGKRMKFTTRPSPAWDFKSEWFYTRFSQLSKAFQNVADKYEGSKLYDYDVDDINKNFEKNMKTKKKNMLPRSSILFKKKID